MASIDKISPSKKSATNTAVKEDLTRLPTEITLSTPRKREGSFSLQNIKQGFLSLLGHQATSSSANQETEHSELSAYREKAHQDISRLLQAINQKKSSDQIDSLFEQILPSLANCSRTILDVRTSLEKVSCENLYRLQTLLESAFQNKTDIPGTSLRVLRDLQRQIFAVAITRRVDLKDAAQLKLAIIASQRPSLLLQPTLSHDLDSVLQTFVNYFAEIHFAAEDLRGLRVLLKHEVSDTHLIQLKIELTEKIYTLREQTQTQCKKAFGELFDIVSQELIDPKKLLQASWQIMQDIQILHAINQRSVRGVDSMADMVVEIVEQQLMGAFIQRQLPTIIENFAKQEIIKQTAFAIFALAREYANEHPEDVSGYQQRQRAALLLQRIAQACHGSLLCPADLKPALAAWEQESEAPSALQEQIASSLTN